MVFQGQGWLEPPIKLNSYKLNSWIVVDALPSDSNLRGAVFLQKRWIAWWWIFHCHIGSPEILLSLDFQTKRYYYQTSGTLKLVASVNLSLIFFNWENDPFPKFWRNKRHLPHIHKKSNAIYTPKKLTWLAGTSTMNDDVFPIEKTGDFPVSHVSFQGVYYSMVVSGSHKRW